MRQQHNSLRQRWQETKRWGRRAVAVGALAVAGMTVVEVGGAVNGTLHNWRSDLNSLGHLLTTNPADHNVKPTKAKIGVPSVTIVSLPETLSCDQRQMAYVDVQAARSHFGGGSKVSKKYEADADICGDSHQITLTKRLVEVGGKVVAASETIPSPMVVRPRIDMNSVANCAPLRPGMSPKKIKQKLQHQETLVANYEKAKADHKKAKAPGCDDGYQITYPSVSIGPITIVKSPVALVSPEDAKVLDTAKSAAQLGAALDILPTAQAQQAQSNLVNEAHFQLALEYPGATIDVAAAPIPDGIALATQRYEDLLHSEPTLSYVFPTEEFKLAGHELEFFVAQPDGINATADLNMTASAQQVRQLNALIPQLNEPPASVGLYGQ